MKKIVFLKTYPEKIGGAELSLKALKDEFDKKNIISSIKKLKAAKFLSSFIKALIFNYQVKKSKKSDELYLSYERVSSSDIYMSGEGVHKLYAKSKKFWFLNPLNFIYPYLEKKAILNSKKIIAVSKLVKKQILDEYKIPASKVEVVYNCIQSQDDFDKDEAKAKLCEDFKLDKDKPIILFVGSGYKRKGVKEFLQILAKLNFEFNAIIIGKDKKEDFYKALAKDLELKVLFLGQRSDILKFYKASDIFLFPSHFEPFGNTVLESMHFKNIAITTKQAGSCELLDENFIMKNPNDFDIVKTLETLVKNKDKMKQIQEQNRQKSLEFAPSKQASKTYKIIKEYL